MNCPCLGIDRFNVPERQGRDSARNARCCLRERPRQDDIGELRRTWLVKLGEVADAEKEDFEVHVDFAP
jgi:hypothetical protein